MDAVFNEIYWIVGIWFILAQTVFLLSVFRGLTRKRADYLPGHSWKAMSWVLVPAVAVLGFDLVMDHQQLPVWKEIKEQAPPAEQVVRVTGKQFVWEIVHPGADGKLGTSDDKTTMNQMYVPVDRVIQLELQSEDVIHSLWIPNLRFKQDVVPGRSIRGWFKAMKPGDYKIGCAELCGVGHGNMGGFLHVLSAADYQKWIEGQ